jgi:hypothetical protein
LVANLTNAWTTDSYPPVTAARFYQATRFNGIRSNNFSTISFTIETLFEEALNDRQVAFYGPVNVTVSYNGSAVAIYQQNFTGIAEDHGYTYNGNYKTYSNVNTFRFMVTPTIVVPWRNSSHVFRVDCDWYDNVTLTLYQTIGTTEPTEVPQIMRHHTSVTITYDARTGTTDGTTEEPPSSKDGETINWLPVIAIIIGIAIFAAVFIGGGSSSCPDQGTDRPAYTPSKRRASRRRTRKTKAATETIAQCIVCNLPIKADQELICCPQCGSPAHRRHLAEWLHINGTCPVCQNKIRI